MDNENKKYLKAAITGAAVIVFGTLSFFILYRLDGIMKFFSGILRQLTPFIYGAVLAYILSPICGKIEAFLRRKTKGKGSSLCKALSILISVLIAVLVVALVIVIIVPQTLHSIVALVNALPGEISNAITAIDGLLEDNAELREWWGSISSQIYNYVNNWTKTDLMPMVTAILGGTLGYISTFLNLIKDVLLALVITIYLLASRQQFAMQARIVLYSLLPDRWAQKTEAEVHYADRMFNGFFMGKLLDSVIVGIICFAGCFFMGFGSASLIGVIVGITNIIPFFGPFIGAIPSALILLLEDPMHCILFLIFILILQQIDGNVIGPRILGNTTGLSGFWVTFAIILFGGLWGIPGMLISIPLFAVIYDVVRQIIVWGLEKRGHSSLLTQYKNQYPGEKTE